MFEGVIYSWNLFTRLESLRSSALLDALVSFILIKGWFLVWREGRFADCTWAADG